MTLRFQHKLSIPSAAYPLIERPYLLERLEQAITSKQVVALAALAGWGKTTALAQWSLYTALPVGWYTLDTTDRDPHQFLDYMLAAVEPYVPGAADVLQRLAGSSPQALPKLFHQAALAIAASPKPFALVIDDYHLLEDESLALLPGIELIFEFLARIAEYAPTCHMILASRMLPNLQGLARLIAQRRAAFFDYDVLSWSAAEVRQLARSTGLGDIVPADAEQLVAQMSGWVTGIILSLDQDVRAQHQPMLDLVDDSGHVYAFFAEQIIAPLAPALQRFLEDTSVIENLSPQRCNALRGTHDAGSFLAEITRRGLFVSDKGGWLAYHSLFRDFLRARLAQDPVRERGLLLRAAELHRDEDDLERALNCYLAAGSEDAASALLHASIPLWRQRSRQNTLLACFERLAAHFESTGRGRILPPDLLLAQVRVYNDLALWERAELALRLAETFGDELVDAEASILYAEILVLQGRLEQAQAVLDGIRNAALPPRLQLEYYLTLGRVQIMAGAAAPAIAVLEQAAQLAPHVVDPARLPSQLAVLADNLGWAYARLGQRAAALRHLKRADACWQASGNHGRRAMTLNNLGMLAMEEGQLAEARVAFDTGLAVAEQSARYREALYLHLSLGELLILMAQPDQALASFQAAYDLAIRIDVPASAADAASGGLWAAALAHQRAAADIWDHTLQTLGELGGPPALVRRKVALTLLRPALNDKDLAPDLLAANAAADALTAPERAYLQLLHAALMFAQGGWSQAAAHWPAFEDAAAGLPDPLLRLFAPAFPALIQAAADASPLARRLLISPEVPAEARWQIVSLGQFACLADGQPCELSPLHRALLVRLIEAGDAGLTVERLWEEVWGDTDIRMSALHKALFRVREQTGLAMAARAGHCAIQSPRQAIRYDAHAFEQALGAATTSVELERALALYQGDFLPGAAPSAALWVDRRRSLLQQHYLDGLERLARLLEDDNPRQAIQYYQRILTIDGCREDTATKLMRLAARQRNHALVTATYQQLEGALRTLGASPEPTTIALLQTSTRGSSFERARIPH